MTRSPTRLVSLSALAMVVIVCVQGCARRPEWVNPLPVNTAEYEALDCHDLVREETSVYHQLDIPIRRQNIYFKSNMLDAAELALMSSPLLVFNMYGLLSAIITGPKSDYRPHTRRDRVTNERNIGRLFGEETALMSVIVANDCEAVTKTNYARPSDPVRLRAPGGLFADTKNRAYLVAEDVTGSMASRSSGANPSFRVHLKTNDPDPRRLRNRHAVRRLLVARNPPNEELND